MKNQESPEESQNLSPLKTEEKVLKINQEKLQIYLDKLRREQQLPLAIVSGFACALFGAIIWAIITVITGFQIGYMALGIGFLVGFTMSITGKGVSNIFGVFGAIFSIFGCLLGNLLSVIGFIANQEGLGYFQTLSLLNYQAIPDIFISTFSPMDLLFYGIAIYIGYKFAFHQLSEAELIKNGIAE